MKSVIELIEETFGFKIENISLPKEIRNKNDLKKWVSAKDYWIQNDTFPEKYLIQHDIKIFCKNVKDGYFSMGFYGYGVNSYAFYYQKKEKNITLFLRMLYGGAYTDNDIAAVKVREYLLSYTNFEKLAKATGIVINIIDSLGAGRYKIYKENLYFKVRIYSYLYYKAKSVYDMLMKVFSDDNKYLNNCEKYEIYSRVTGLHCATLFDSMNWPIIRIVNEETKEDILDYFSDDFRCTVMGSEHQNIPGTENFISEAIENLKITDYFVK